ncbi:kinesin light chain 3 [Fusarium heterosporum]|uniref:Kinesin light chain 3 n=1 Tax=Fusarium heterosporum TaxID=42747 RepID=A0A8H5TQY1_FUSHE|nr:kinesin light chain 3 [Fusarium heterosporum]
MEGIGVAANIIAVVDISLKVMTLCLQYSKEVSSARVDIERLHNQVGHLATTMRATQHLVEGDKGASLSTSQGLFGSFRSCISDLEQLEKKLDPNSVRSVMRRYGIRAIKWPFKSKEVDQLLANLDRHEKTILLGLQVDQTAILVDIQEGVKQLRLQPAHDTSNLLKHHLMVPFTPDPDFVHRPTIERWMREQYNKPSQRMALVGMGGFGKSQLAIQFAHRVHAEKPGTSVFWVHGGSKAAFDESYRSLADVIALPRRHEPEVNVLALVHDWLQRDDVPPWLMVFDNADDITTFFADEGPDNQSRARLAAYLPKSTNGKIIVTSRSLDAAERLVGSVQNTLQIPTMAEEQALELLQGHLTDETDEAAAKDLVRMLDCIPLAVKQAAAYINRRSPRVTPASYLEEFSRSDKRKDSLLRSDKGDLGRQDGVSNSIVVTWQVTFEQIKRDQPRAANLLSLMSQFQAQNIPEFMLHDYKDNNTPNEKNDVDGTGVGSESDGESEKDDFEDDLDLLRGYSLVDTSTIGFCNMHPLVQFCTRSWISEFGDSERWSRLFMKLAADHFPNGVFETWTVCQTLLPHVEPLLRSKPRGETVATNWIELLTNASRYMQEIGDFNRAQTLAKVAVQATTSILGLDSPETPSCMNILSEIYSRQGRLKDAEQLQAEALQIRKTILGPDHVDTLISMDHLATIFRKQGRLEEAEKLSVEVTKSCQANLGLVHNDTLISMGNLAVIFLLQGRFEEAEKLETEVMEIRQAKLGYDHPDALTSMNNLAMAFRGQGRLYEAEKLDLEVMKTRQVKLGLDHPDTLISMSNLAGTFLEQRRSEEAEKLSLEVMKTHQIKLGLDHPDTLVSMSNLASAFWQQGRLDEAEKLGVEVMETRKVKLGVDHPKTLNSMYNLAYIWHSQGRLEDSIALMGDCLDLFQEKLGHNHPDTQLSAKTLESWQTERFVPEGASIT